MQLFKEVLSSYLDPETNNIAIDGYFKNDDSDNDGVIVAWVKPDGLVILGDNAKPEYLVCDLVQSHIRDAVVYQLKLAQESLSRKVETVIKKEISSPQEYVLRLNEALENLRAGFVQLNRLLEKEQCFNINTVEFVSQQYPFGGSSISELTAKVDAWVKNSLLRLKKAVVVPAEYVSVWDGNEERRTPCKFDLMTSRAFDIGQSDEVEDLDILEEEYIEISESGKVYYDFESEDGYKVVKGKKVDEDDDN